MNRMLVTAAFVAAAIAGPALAASLATGATAPDFKLTAYENGNPSTFSLKDQLKKGPVVLYFFPGAYTPGCNVEAQAFAAKIDDFKAAGAQVVGVTGYAGTSARTLPVEGGLNEAVRDFSKTHCNGKFPVVAADAAVIAAYGVANTQRPTMSDRTSFVISKDDKIVLAHTDPLPNSHIDLTLKEVQDLKAGK